MMKEAHPLFFFGDLVHSWPYMGPPGTAYLLFDVDFTPERKLRRKEGQEHTFKKAISSESPSLQLVLSIS